MLLAALALQPDEPLKPLFRFAREDPFAPTTVQVEMGLMSSGAKRWHYWFRRTDETKHAETRTVTQSITWTDTERCPAALSVAKKAAGLRPPRVAVHAINSDDSFLIVNGVHYSFEGDSQYAGSEKGRISFTGAEDTPLAVWIDASLKKLERCWSNDRPQRAIM